MWPVIQLTIQDNQRYKGTEYKFISYSKKKNGVNTQRSIYCVPREYRPQRLSLLTGEQQVRSLNRFVTSHCTWNGSGFSAVANYFMNSHSQCFVKCASRKAAADSFVLRHPSSAVPCKRICRKNTNFLITGSPLGNRKTANLALLAHVARFTLGWNVNNQSNSVSL